MVCGNGRFDRGPAVAAGAETGDQHHCRRAGTVTMHVKSGAVHRNEFVDEGGGSCDVVDGTVVVVGSGVVSAATSVVDGTVVVVGSPVVSRGATVEGETVVAVGSWAVPGACATGRVAAPGECDRDAQGGGDCSDDGLGVHVSLPVRRRVFRCGRR